MLGCPSGVGSVGLVDASWSACNAGAWCDACSAETRVTTRGGGPRSLSAALDCLLGDVRGPMTAHLCVQQQCTAAEAQTLTCMRPPMSRPNWYLRASLSGEAMPLTSNTNVLLGNTATAWARTRSECMVLVLAGGRAGAVGGGGAVDGSFGRGWPQRLGPNALSPTRRIQADCSPA